MAPTTPIKPPQSASNGELYPWWVAQPPRLTGNPTPFWESHHGGDYTHGDRLGRFAHKIERPLFAWQWDCERKALATRPDGLWAHPDVCWIITRQAGKTQLVVMRILYGLFYLDEKIVYTAQRWLTVKDVYDRVVEIIESRPHLKRRLATKPTDAGNHGLVELKSGASLNMGPRTRAVGRGQTRIDLAIFDEAYDLPDLSKSHLTGAQSASANPQTIYISTAAVQDLHPNCHVLAGMRRNAIRGEPDLYGAEWRAPDGMSSDDPEAWRLAHPSFGVTLRAREVARELRAARTTTMRQMFEADYLGWGDWPPDDADIAPPIPKEVWCDLRNPAPELVGDICLAVERTLDRRWWCIAAGQRTFDGRVHVEVGYWRVANIGQAAAAVMELMELFDPPAIVVDAKSKAAPIAPFLRNQGIECVVTNTVQLAVATSGFVDAVMAGDITHVGQQLLEEAIETAVMRELPRGDQVWDEGESGQATAPLKAVTLAHWAVLTYAQERRKAASPSTGEDVVDLDDANVLDVHF